MIFIGIERLSLLCKVEAGCRPMSVGAADLHELSAGAALSLPMLAGLAVLMAVQPDARGWHDQRVDLADLQLNLRYLLNQWDPIGVAEIAPDEYDCMMAPLLTRLRAGAGRAEISEFLWYELEDHFGLDPARYEVDSVANRLVAWWAAVGPTP